MKFYRLEKSHVIFVLHLESIRVCEVIRKTVRTSTPCCIFFSLFVLPFMQGGASTALMIAAQHGHCEMIQELLGNGADINAVNKVVNESNAVTVYVCTPVGFVQRGRFFPIIFNRQDRNNLHDSFLVL